MTLATGTALENTVIRASAGSGKTNALTSRFMRLMASDVPSRHVLATTFTRKAAGEILDRIMVSLADIATNSPRAPRTKQRLGLADLSSAQCRGILRELLDNLHRLRIGTIDSFFAALARSFSLELGLPPDWQIGTPAEIGRIRNRAVSTILSREDSIQLLQLMAKGETIRGAHKMMSDTIEQLYQIFLESRREAWFTLPEHPTLDAKELVAAIEHLETLSLPTTQMTKRRDSDVLLAKAGDWDGLISVGLTPKVLDGSHLLNRSPIPADVVAAYRPILEHARGVIANELKAATEATYSMLERFHQEFDAAKAESGKLRFDDVTRRLADWTRRRAKDASAEIAFRLDGTVDHLLLDEFQDTSPDQWFVLEPFARHVTQPRGDGSFFCVGDEKQAIYGWRGGVSEVFDLVDQQIPRLQHVSLTQSYRASPILMETLNHIFQRIGNYKPANTLAQEAIHGWCHRYLEHTTARKDRPGHFTIERVSVDEDETYDRAVTLVDDLHRRAPDKTIGVLTRENREVAELIAALHRAGVPASEEGGNPLTDSVAVQLILSLVQLADHPGDSLSWFHVAGSPLGTAYQLPPCRLPALRTPEEKSQLYRIAADIRRELLESGYGACVSKWAHLLAPHCTRRELQRLQKLIEVADEYDSLASLHPAEFIAHVNDARIEDATSSQVRVMTIHKAKGLEFDAVVLPCVSKTLSLRNNDVLIQREQPTEPISLVLRRANEQKRRLLPEHYAAAHRQQAMRSFGESMCELYVALTRAKHALHIILKPRDAATHQSMAGILLATLGDSPRNERLIYECGTPDWTDFREADEAAAESRPSDAPTSPQTRPRIQVAATAPRIRVAASPTHSAREHTPIRDWIGTGAGREARQRGSLLHAGLAEIEWLDGTTDRGRLLASLRRQFSAGDELSNAVDEIMQCVRRPRLESILTRDKYLQQISAQAVAGQSIFEALTASVFRERSFAVRVGDSIQHGIIDRLVLIHEGNKLWAAEVIEFKSDRMVDPTPDEIAQSIDGYRPQVNAYRQAVAATYRLPLDRVFGRLVLLGIDRDFEIR